MMIMKNKFTLKVGDKNLTFDRKIALLDLIDSNKFMHFPRINRDGQSSIFSILNRLKSIHVFLIKIDLRKIGEELPI